MERKVMQTSSSSTTAIADAWVASVQVLEMHVLIAYHVNIAGCTANQRPPLALRISRYCPAS